MPDIDKLDVFGVWKFWALCWRTAIRASPADQYFGWWVEVAVFPRKSTPTTKQVG